MRGSVISSDARVFSGSYTSDTAVAGVNAIRLIIRGVVIRYFSAF